MKGCKKKKRHSGSPGHRVKGKKKLEDKRIPLPMATGQWMVHPHLHENLVFPCEKRRKREVTNPSVRETHHASNEN